MTKKILYLIVFINLFNACNKSSKIENISIDPERFITKEIKLSEFSDGLLYIPLSNKPLFSRIYTIQSMDNKLFIGVNPQRLNVYDIKGNFLYYIGKMGRGPGEYQSAFKFTLDNENKQLYILDKNKILVFTEKGDYKRNIDISDFGGNFDAIGYNDGYIYLFENIKFGQAKYSWLIIDKQGREINSKLNNILKFKTTTTQLINLKFKFNNHFCYWNSLNDTIFDVYPTKYKSRYQFARGNFRVTTENIGDMKLYSSRVFIPRGFWESKSYLFFKYFMESKTGFGLLDKTNEQIFALEQKRGQENGRGFINDLDGGLNFTPINYIFINNQEYLIGWFDAFKLKEHIKSKAFKTSTPKYPEKKKELEKLANSLKDDDNPVLMLVKLKE